MRLPANELFDKLGVGFVLEPYGSCPWSAYDAEKGVTCSVDVHMAPGNEAVEAEGQMMYDDGRPVDQFFTLRADPSGDQWEVTQFKVRGKDHGRDRGGWQGFACDFVKMLSQALQADEMPNIDELLEESFNGKDRAGGGGSGGGRSVKMKNPSTQLTLRRGR